MIQLSPLESLVKNVVLSVLLFIAWPCPEWRIPQRSNITLFVIAFCLVFPSLLSPPDFIVHYPDMPGDTMQIAGKRMHNNPEMIANQAVSGKKMVCMFSTHCSYCMHAAEKVSIIADKYDLDDEVLYAFTGDTADLANFWKESRSIQFHYFFMPTRSFFEIAGPSVPSIYLVENGEVKAHFHYRNINEHTIKNFFSQP
jgi:thiol-disulfide isomerase/thioredoxin